MLEKMRRHLVIFRQKAIDVDGNEFESAIGSDGDTSDDAKDIEHQSLFKRIGGLPVIQKVTENVFEMVYNDPELEKFYSSRNLSTKLISKKYAYFLAIQMGMKKVWLGRDISECHNTLSENSDSKISQGQIKKMVGFFRIAV
jgi:hypothetical protein